MKYILKLFDINLIEFTLVDNLANPVVHIDWKSDKKELFPLGMESTDEGLASWLKTRSIPKNRQFVNSFLAKCGLNANRPMDIISICKGLSLNDSYWVVEQEYDGKFNDNNLYDNNFSRVLAMIAFTGYGSNVRSSFNSSPEFTTNGMLPKCWRRIDGKIYLYKGATSGYSNSGMEPFSELYASQLGKKAGFNVTPYRISKWKGIICSNCELFTSKKVSYVPIGRIVKSGGMSAVRDYYIKLGPQFVQALDEMIIFDAIICNTDRHFGNFGVLVDSKTNQILKPAPLFDHGNSLFNFAGEENWTDIDSLQKYVDTLLPCVYEDFVEEAKKVINESSKKKLRKLLNYKVVKEGRYNYSVSKLKLMNEIVNRRVKMILGE